MTSTSDSTPAQAGPPAPQAPRPPGFPRSLVAHPAYGPLPALLLILTVVTGVVDSISILALGRVFVANMTGNVVFAGFAIVGAPGFSLGASLFALAGFLVGAAAGGAVITRVGSDRAALLRAGTAAEVALAAVALVLAALSGDPGVSHGTTHIIAGAFGLAITDALAAVLAAAMGIQNAVARKLAVPDLTTTVLTMTLTGIGADLRAVLRAGDTHATAKSDLVRRLLAIGTMLAGALAGASLTLYVSPVSALALALSLLAVTAAAAMAVATRPAPWRTPSARPK
ncbi:MAG: YoaK family protein [Trebonia sp.]